MKYQKFIYDKILELGKEPRGHKFDEVLDSRMLMEAIEKDEEKRPLEEIARELGLDS